MTRRIVGPFNRVEGDLEVTLDIEDGRVTAARVNSPLFRGFEPMLAGRDPRDALVLTPRICGICSVAQSMASALALAAAQGVEAPLNGALMRNIILGTENAADHLTHFYLFFMPDLAKQIYAGEPWHAAIEPRFRGVDGTAVRDMLPARSAFMHIMGTLAGHWPHTLGLQPGGSTQAIDGAAQARVLATIAAFRRFVEAKLFGDRLETVAGLSTREELHDWSRRPGPAAGDFAAFLRVAEALSLDRLGRAGDRFMSYGAYTIGGAHLFRRGLYAGGAAELLDPLLITEDVSASWLKGSNGPRHPSRGVTLPDADAPDGYTWCKAPRLADEVVEVGALARQVVDGQPLALDLVAGAGGNVMSRVVGRLVELARLVPMLEAWTRRIVPREPFYTEAIMPDEAEGAGLIEAARGSLGHWITIRHGRILNYQIVAPTTWNFSPRDGAGRPGACERALEGAPVRPGETDPIAVQHIVRSFDPCMVCTVH
jgi:hydrogenase large subunit